MATFSAAVGVVRKKATNRFHVPVNLDVRRMMKDPAWNEWFKLNLRCSQSTFELLCKLLEPHFPPVAYLRYNFETGVACTLFQLASSDGYRETAAAMGVSKVWCVKAVNRMIRVLCCKCPDDPIIPTGGTTAKDKHHSIFKLCVIIEKTSCHLTFTQDPGATVIFGSIRSLTTAS
ncbi:hypothetical protein PC120_g20440 [Phytophthora cactorum]|nr:hypothetical protein PC120_g20440 [Phytophthora cactorum]